MAEVFKELPNIVRVVISDKTGTAERFVVGRSLDEVIESVDPGANHEKHIKANIEFGNAIAKKPRKLRRTKAEMAKDRPGPDISGATLQKTEKEESVWP